MVVEIYNRVSIKSGIGWLLLLMPFFPVSIIEYYWEESDLLFDIWKIFSIFIILVLIFINEGIGELLLNAKLGLVFTWWFILFVSTLANGGNVLTFIKNVLAGIFPILLLVMLLQRNELVCLSYLTSWLWLLIILNFASILIYPEGIYRSYSDDLGWYSDAHWILGHKNIIIGIFLFTIIVSFLNSYFMYGRVLLRYKVGMILCTIEAFLMDSQTSAFILAIICVFTFFIPLGKIIEKIDSRWIVIGEIVLFVGIVISKVYMYFSFIIQDIMGRSMTLSGRTTIWPVALKMISEKPWIGYGIRDYKWITSSLGRSWAVHTHCQYLEWAFTGGIFLFVTGVILFWQCAKNINDIQPREIQILMKAVLLGLMTGMQTEVFMFKTLTIQVWYVIVLMVSLNQSQIDYYLNYVDDTISPIRILVNGKEVL